MSAHTPGPWTQSGAGIIRGANGVVVADARTEAGIRSDHERAANIALLVRAHEIPGLEAQRDALADVLEDIHRRMDRWAVGNVQPGLKGKDSDMPLLRERIKAALRAAGRLP